VTFEGHFRVLLLLIFNINFHKVV